MKKYTYSAKRSDNPEKWYVLDANGAVLGRFASQVAQRLRGKHNPLFTPHADTGDWVIVINADKIVLTGRKMDQKIYYRHSGYIGSTKEATLAEKMEKDPTDVVVLAVKGMLPKNKLHADRMARLKVYAGEEHPHEAQKPQKIGDK